MTFSPPDVTHTFAPTQRSSSSEVNTNYDDIVEQFLLGTYTSNGWRVGTFELVYNSANSLESATDVDLVNLLEPGMKITFEQATNGEYMAFITHVDYDTTVANRSYVEVFVYNQTNIIDEALLVDTLGFSRHSLPQGFPPIGDNGWRLRFRDTANRTISGANANTLYNPGSTQLTIPRGTWNIYAKVVCVVTGTNSYLVMMSTSSSSVSNIDYRQRSQSGGGTVNIDTNTWYFQEDFTSSTTYYLLIESQLSGVSTLRFHGADGSTLIEARPAYQ